jgi:hypothetical protein
MTKTLWGWDWERDDITWVVVCRRLTQREASRLAHALERAPAPAGYDNILTVGI